MATVTETAYPRLPGTIGPSDLRTLFAITRRERRWLSTLRFDPDARRDTAVYLKCFQCLGYFPRSSTIPPSVVQFVCSELKLDPLPSISPNQRSSHRIKQAVRRFCRVKVFTAREHEPWLSISPARWRSRRRARSTSSMP